MNIINLTPHALTLRDLRTGTDTVIPPSGTAARVATQPGQVRPRGTFLMTAEGDLGWTFPCEVYGPTTYGEVEGLPEPVDGTIYLVSGMVLAAVRDRDDVFAPGTGPADGAIREPVKLSDGLPNPKAGQIVAVTRLIAAV